MGFSVLVLVDVMQKTENSEDTGKYLPPEDPEEDNDKHDICLNCITLQGY